MPNAAINTKPQSVQGNSGNWYGNGTNHANKVQNLTFYYDKAGIEAATAKSTFSRFADSRFMPQNRGREYRITVWQHIYDRQIFNEMTTIGGNKTYTADFQKLGYLSSRDLATVTDELYGANGKFGTANYADNGKVLLEGEGPTNKVSVQGLTISTKLEKFGEMLDYTEEVDMFSEDKMQVRYRQELGYSANQLFEDLVQLDMLATPTVMYAGSASSLATLGDGIGAGTPDAVTGRNAVEESYKINYNLIQKAVKKLYVNRTPKHNALTTGSTKVGTEPITSSYVALIGPEIRIDLENMVRGYSYERNFVFTPVSMYASQTTLLEGECGRIHDIRFCVVESMLVERGVGADVDNAYVGTLSYSGTIGNDAKFDVFPILIPGKGSFATIGLQGADKIVFRSIAPSDIDRTDPFGSNGLFSYKMWYAGIILRPERLLRINVLASA